MHGRKNISYFLPLGDF